MQQIKRGFTLIELLIVIIIIGAVYLLYISGMGKKNQITPLRFEELKESILKASGNQPARLTCRGESCGECTLTPRSGEPITMTLFSAKPKLFTYDSFGYLEEVRYDDETCFDYTVYDNLSSDNLLVEREGKYYIFYAYLKETEIFETYDQAVERFDPMKTIYLDTNDYYYGKE